MITLMDKGDYRLIETKSQVKILFLNDLAYAWVWAKDIGEILVTTHQPHKIDHILAVGRFRLYDVENEPKFIDNQHLELLIGDGQWQGYLLLTGLPTAQKIRSRIIPTKELIT
jgi:hypothetical protein